MGQPRRARKRDWEMALIEAVARRFDTRDLDELRAELARHLLRLNQRSRDKIRNWKAFLRTALRNKAANWIRDEQSRRKRFSSLDPPDEDGEASLMDVIPGPERDLDQSIALTRALEELDPELKGVWDALREEDGHQIRAARRLGRHRNTVAAAVHKIRDVFIGQGLVAPSQKDTHRHNAARQKPSRPPVKRNVFIAISERLLQSLITRHLSGCQWRILLWVIRKSARRKQPAVPFQWPEIAEALSLERGSVGRAGRVLIRNRILFTENKRVGLRRNFRNVRRE